MFTVQMGEDEFRIVGPDNEEGDTVAYGELATLTIDEAIYYCQLDDPNSETPVVYRVDQITAMPTQEEEVSFEDSPEKISGPVLVGTEVDEEVEPEG